MSNTDTVVAKISRLATETTIGNVEVIAHGTKKSEVVYSGLGLSRAVAYGATYLDRNLDDVRLVEVVWAGHVIACYSLEG